MKALRHFNLLIVSEIFMYEKNVLSAQNDFNFGCENIESGSEILLAYKTKYTSYTFFFVFLLPFWNCGNKKEKNRLEKKRSAER